MKPYLLQMLKEIALLGALNNKVEISSLDLAKQLQSSQQTASRYLLELDKLSVITREMGIKKQLIKITEKGRHILKDEYSQYEHIFDMPTRIHFRGTIVSGMGEGTYYIAQEGYVKQFKERLGFKPYPGTLNIKIKEIEKNKLRLIKHHQAIHVDSFKTRHRTFGDVKCFHAKINDKPCALVLPLRGHYSSVLEFIARENLREKIGLTDGDTANITIDLENQGSCL